MNGFNNLVLPFRLNFREVVENKEAVLNGLSAIQRFFDGNIWLPLGANVETLFVRGVLGATDDLCDWFEVPASWPSFEPEKAEEKEHLWYFFLEVSDFSFFFYNFHHFLVFVVVFIRLKKPQEGFRRYREIFSVMHSRILWWLESWQDVFHPSPGVFHFPLVRQQDAPFFELFFAPPPRRGWHEEFEFSEDSDELSEFEDFDYV